MSLKGKEFNRGPASLEARGVCRAACWSHVPPKEGRTLFPHPLPLVGSWFCGQREQTLLGAGTFILPKASAQTALSGKRLILPKATPASRWGELLKWNETPEILTGCIQTKLSILCVKMCSLGDCGSCLTWAAHYFSHLCLARQFSSGMRFRNRMTEDEIMACSILFRISSKQKQIVWGKQEIRK